MQRSEQAAAENLWMEFLNLRQKVIQQFHREGKDFNEIARVISLTGSQVKTIHSNLNNQPLGSGLRRLVHSGDHDWKPCRDIC